MVLHLMNISARLFLLIITVFASVPCMAQSKWGELTGIVIYRGDDGVARADGGAELVVWYIDSVKSPALSDLYHKEDSIVSNARGAALYYDLYTHTPITRTRRQMLKKLEQL